MKLDGIRQVTVLLAAAALFPIFYATPNVVGVTPFRAKQSIIAEGSYVYGSSSDPTRENWTLSKAAEGRYVAEGNATHYQPETEILNYRIEMDAALHPSLVELHTSMDYPSYACKLSRADAQCILTCGDCNPPTSGPQNARMQPPFDLFGFHSYGWILSSVVGRLRPGQSEVTVHLFLPNEDRYPNAVAQVRREPPDSITIAGKTIEAQRFTVKLVMDTTDTSACSVWTSRSGLVLQVQPIGKAPGGDLPSIKLTSYKQTEAFVPEF
jgi:hypothetical protein